MMYVCVCGCLHVIVHLCVCMNVCVHVGMCLCVFINLNAQAMLYKHYCIMGRQLGYLSMELQVSEMGHSSCRAWCRMIIIVNSFYRGNVILPCSDQWLTMDQIVA